MFDVTGEREKGSMYIQISVVSYRSRSSSSIYSRLVGSKRVAIFILDNAFLCALQAR